MFLRRLGKRGTAVVEYAIILAFVAAVGSSFTSDASMGGSIKSIITNVEQLLGLAAGKEETGNRFKLDDNAQEYAVFMDNLINKMYEKFNTDPEHPPRQIWIESGGFIAGYTPWPDDNGQGGGYIKLSESINARDFLPSDCTYQPHGNTVIYFDKSGKVVNNGSGQGGNDVSHVNCDGGVMLTFNENTGTFGKGSNYWNQ